MSYTTNWVDAAYTDENGEPTKLLEIISDRGGAPEVWSLSNVMRAAVGHDRFNSAVPQSVFQEAMQLVQG